MSRNGNFVAIVIILLTLLSCKGRHKDVIPNQNIETIDIIGSFESKGDVKLSSVTDSVEYIKLESSDKCMAGDPYMIAVRDSIIILIEFRKMLVFNRFTGAFEYEISTFGRGPSEFRTTHTNGYDELNNLIYVSSFKDKQMGFSTNGSLKTIFNLPKSNWEIGKEHNINSFWPYAENQYIGYSENISGVNPIKLERFDSTGRILFQYPNYNFFDKKKYNGNYRTISDGWFFCYNDSTRFFEMYTDTIYTVLDKKLYPRYYIKMEKLSPPYYLMAVSLGLEYKHFDYFHLQKVSESSRFLFFTLRLKNYRHLCFYDKKLKETRVCDILNDKEHYEIQITYADSRVSGRARREKETRTIGLVDDINNFISFGVGNNCIYINRNNEIIAYIQASDVERWFKMNPDKAKNLPENLKKYSEIKATDNIIVMVLKLKT